MEIAIHLHAVGIDDRALASLRQTQRQRGLPAVTESGDYDEARVVRSSGDHGGSMTTASKFIVVILTTYLASAPALAEPDTFHSQVEAASKLSDIFFSESRNWLLVDALPKPPPPDLVTPVLRRLASLVPGDCFSHPDNGGIIMKPQTIADHLHATDLFGVGDDDIIYAGPSDCREGDVTVIWRHVHDPIKAIAVRADFLLLRIEKSPTPHFTAVEPGCCTTPFDDYYSGAAFPLPGPTVIRTLKVLSIPDGSIVHHGSLTFKRPTLLSWDLEADEETNTKLRDFLTSEGEGIKDRTYPRAIEAEQILQFRDKKGRVWSLVTVHRQIDDKSAANVGWVAN